MATGTKIRRKKIADDFENLIERSKPDLQKN
jgi:hypothetical protein